MRQLRLRGQSNSSGVTEGVGGGAGASLTRESCSSLLSALSPPSHLAVLGMPWGGPAWLPLGLTRLPHPCSQAVLPLGLTGLDFLIDLFA